MASLDQSFPPLLCQVCVRVHFQNDIWVNKGERKAAVISVTPAIIEVLKELDRMNICS